MKTPYDPRHKKRQKSVQELFAWSFLKKKPEVDLVNSVISDLSKIDKIIIEAAPEWPIEKIAKVDLAILRLGIYELLQGSEPKKVIIDEAIELAKEFGTENSAKFINGALGKALDIIEDTKEGNGSKRS